ncbi:acyltransferase [Massilia sp. 9096]|uniref:acyltransferase family protein n=1 Tax=Massilia sp. 9096 TaxID=1500894 RepID=UPI00068BE28B|nr:acyltransferase [Massilia sp. 9096]
MHPQHLPHNETARLRGLDLLRAAAIVLVMMSHYAGFVAGAPVFGALGAVGWAGVDLFFVLSGYLIGNQLLAPVARGETLSLKVFFARRLLRTLPNYYVVLAVYVLLPHSPIAGSTLPPLWKMLTFTQNIGLAYGQTFSHSWSLCIEEQFYVVLPLAVLAFARLKRSPRLAWCVLGGAILFGVAARAVAWLDYGHEAFSAEVYYSSFGRFDELLPGVAIAMLRNFHPATFARLQRHANRLLAIGLALSIAVLTCIRHDWPSLGVASIFGFSLLAIGFGLMTCAALTPACLLNRIRVPGAAQLALWSYAVYLAHKPVFMALRPWCERMHVDTHAPLVILAIMAVAVFAGWVLYRVVETPFMRLRARWYPGNRTLPSPTAALTEAPAALRAR